MVSNRLSSYTITLVTINDFQRVQFQGCAGQGWVSHSLLYKWCSVAYKWLQVVGKWYRYPWCANGWPWSTSGLKLYASGMRSRKWFTSGCKWNGCKWSQVVARGLPRLHVVRTWLLRGLHVVAGGCMWSASGLHVVCKWSASGRNQWSACSYKCLHASGLQIVCTPQLLRRAPTDTAIFIFRRRPEFHRFWRLHDNWGACY